MITSFLFQFFVNKFAIGQAARYRNGLYIFFSWYLKPTYIYYPLYQPYQPMVCTIVADHTFTGGAFNNYRRGILFFILV